MDWFVTLREVGEDGELENVLKTYRIDEETNEMTLVRVEDGSGEVIWEEGMLFVTANILEGLVYLVPVAAIIIIIWALWMSFK